MEYKELKKYCSKVYRIVREKEINGEVMSSNVVSDYYSKSSFYYRKFHSSKGAMHLSVSFSNTTPHHEKLLYQADSINKVIDEHAYSNILELGCGMGFNTVHLATQNPGKSFTGVDLTPNNIRQCEVNAKGLENASFKEMDFDSLSQLTEKYDLIFAIETLCHSKDVVKLVSSLEGMLTENGRIVIFDGYEKEDHTGLEKEFEKKAYKLMSWGFALEKFQELKSLKTAREMKVFSFEEIKDYTENVLPNYKAFERGSLKSLKYSRMLKLLLRLRIIPLALIKQMSAGAFGPHFLENGFLGYYKLTLIKKRA